MLTTVEGPIVDILGRQLFEGSVVVDGDRIVDIRRHPTSQRCYILPGFIDAHVHIESSMLTPEFFGQLAIEQGTIAVVADPHEIANVLGLSGVDFMLENSKKSPIKTFFTMPSCVPATSFDSSGGEISTADIEKMAASGEFVALSEMMNVQGVVFGDEQVMAKIDIARRYNLPIDGHAPLLAHEDLAKYASANISTDHECVTIEEANAKAALGINVIIREGSAARNFEALQPLIGTNSDSVMFCADDSHPQQIISGHIRMMVQRAVSKGFNLYDILRVASLNPIEHYKLDVGQLRIGDRADFIVVDNLTQFNVQAVYVDGEQRLVAFSPEYKQVDFNNFNLEPITPASLSKRVDAPIKVISIIDNELITTLDSYTPSCEVENLQSDPEHNLAKIVYINRYNNGTPQVAYCKGFGMVRGAIASSVSHDSHNIIAVGCSDEELAQAINAIIQTKGGLSLCCEGEISLLPLPIGGIMSDCPGPEVARSYQRLGDRVLRTGCLLASPFMTLSFMSLVVIPEVKIGEKGLFSYSDFDWIEQ